ncbi:MAG: aminotransferase class III-fold pyridoxal phosphate-dependent enzyme [Candidatus Marsarchaeota archaeon]|jgi:4-aminobutyrate aminotransferase|nr:aminotransferase class III-fold pyridoxal phosphate-dependent enzyme [Candidatus Marsarchaeota archaeon]
MVKIGDRTRRVIARDKKVFLTTTREVYPFVADHGNGDFVYDFEGNKFLDFSSFISVYNLGVNGTPEIRKAVIEQAGKLMHSAFTDYYAELPVEFAENLLKLMPSGFGKMFLSNSGTEANEAAIKFSKLFTDRQYLMAFYNAFHGRSTGSLALTASKTVQREHFGPFSDTVHVPYAYCYRCPLKQTYPDCGFACIDYIKKYPLSKEVSGKEIAAFVFEPIQGEGGYVVPPMDYFKEIKKLADDYGMLLIDDEVQAGYMRTGKFLALDNFGIKADIYTMAKAVGGGMPLGVTVTSTSLGDIPSGSHATTFGGNLVSIAAANASIKYILSNKQKISREVVQKGALMMKRLVQMKEDYEIIGDVRGIGLMIGVELVKDKKSKVPAVKEREGILNNLFQSGMLVLPAGESSIRLIPPLTISYENLEKGMDLFESAIAKASKRNGMPR